MRRLLLCLAALGVPAFLLAADTSYLVRRGDTLYGIARHNAISVGVLAERNSLTKNQHLYVGQRLVIPSPPGTVAPLAPALPILIENAITKAAVIPKRWKSIVIHHSGTEMGNAKGMDRYHREARHMENGLAYHFVIGNGKGLADGKIVVGSRWSNQLDGGHLRSERQNRTSLGVCLVGDFEKHSPTPKQMQQLTALVQVLLSRCNLSADAVKTHQQINVRPTRCPGRFFPTHDWLKSLRHPTQLPTGPSN